MFFDKKDKYEQEKFDVYRKIESYLNDFRASTKKRVPVLYLYNFRCFKGFHAIELADLTYLYGANSTGKSTIQDALNEAIDVLKRKRTIGRSSFLNKTWGLGENEPYGIGLGGLWGEVGGWDDVDHALNARYSDNEKTEGFFNEIAELLYGGDVTECWDAFYITGGKGFSQDKPSYFLWWTDQLLMDYSLGYMTLYDVISDYFRGQKLTEYFEKEISNHDSWFDEYDDRVVESLASDYDDIRLESDLNPNAMTISDLRPEGMRKKLGILSTKERFELAIKQSKTKSQSAKEVQQKKIDLSQRFEEVDSIAINLLRGLERKRNPETGALEVISEGNRVVSKDFWDWGQSVLELSDSEYNESFFDGSNNIVVQILLYLIDTVPKLLAKEFDTKSISSLRKIPSNTDMQSIWVFTKESWGMNLSCENPRDDLHGDFAWEALANNVMRSRSPDMFRDDYWSYLNRLDDPKALSAINRFLSSKNWLDSSYELDWSFEEGWELDKNGEYQSDYPSKVKVVFKLKSNGVPTSFDKIGTGYSQVLPVITGLLSFKRVFIAQPELHLHPKRAFALGRFLVDTVKKKIKNRIDRERFVVKSNGKQVRSPQERHDRLWAVMETHSRELLEPALKAIADKKFSKDDVRIYVLTQEKGVSSISQVRVDDDGDFMDPWPGGYFDETTY